jgi:hypothetical protein
VDGMVVVPKNRGTVVGIVVIFVVARWSQILSVAIVLRERSHPVEMNRSTDFLTLCILSQLVNKANAGFAVFRLLNEGTY